MECVEYYFNKIYGDDDEIEIQKIVSLIRALMLVYKDKAKESVGSDTCENHPTNGIAPISNSGRGRNLFSLHKQKNKKRKVNVTAEFDHYLEDGTLPDDIDCLAFWKTNFQYPTLREIAKDVLAIPVTSIASESAFSTGGRVLSPHRSRLHSNTVEALMRLQNWMTGGCLGMFHILIFFFIKSYYNGIS